MKNHVLCHEDFQDFPIGEFPYDPDHSAMGEYQYVTAEGYSGRWLDQVCNYTWNGAGPTWLITEQNGRHAMECMRVEKNKPHRMFPTLETGAPSWRNYAVSVTLRRLSLRGTAGLVFCLNHSADTLVFALEEHGAATLTYRHKEELHPLGRAAFPQNPDDDYRLSVDVQGDAVRCCVDGVPLIEARTSVAARGGKVGITADCPARFSEFEALVSPEEAQAIALREARRAALEAGEAAQHPAMKLWKKIDLKNHGTSRQVRFGHLLGDGSWQVVLAQMQRRVSRDAYGFISCLTAIDLDGNVLWQLGEPSGHADRLGKVSADMPLQVYDIDGDGAEELLVWSGEVGTGGEGWSVMTRRSGVWRCAGRIFGVVYFVDRPPHRGLVVESPCGWRYADWEYFELENGVLKSRIKLAIRYRRPEGNILRTRPEEIVVKEK